VPAGAEAREVGSWDARARVAIWRAGAESGLRTEIGSAARSRQRQIKARKKSNYAGANQQLIAPEPALVRMNQCNKVFARKKKSMSPKGAHVRIAMPASSWYLNFNL
jgi:hypothetical protein